MAGEAAVLLFDGGGDLEVRDMVKASGARGILLSGMLAICASASASATILEGQEVAIEKCSGCHAIREEGLSPNPKAPPLRGLGTRYPIDSLSESFLKGMEVGHQDMPILILAPEEVTNLLLYIRSLDPCGKPASDKAAMAKCFAPVEGGK